MGEVRYGHVEGPGKGREYPVKASQYLHRRGGKFVKLVSGQASLCASLDSYTAGWVNEPRDENSGAKDCFKTDSGDSLFVVYGLEDVFELPAYETVASCNATAIGANAGFWITNATYTMYQSARISPAVAASPLQIVDVDTVNKTVKVKIKPAKKQPI